MEKETKAIGELYIKLFRPSTGDVFKALRTDSAGIAELLMEGWEIAAPTAAPRTNVGGDGLSDQDPTDMRTDLEDWVKAGAFDEEACRNTCSVCPGNAATGGNWPCAKKPIVKVARPNHSIKDVCSAKESALNYNMDECPVGQMCLLLGRGGVLQKALGSTDSFWVAWAPLPKRDKEEEKRRGLFING
jgi:hypothetical protein